MKGRSISTNLAAVGAAEIVARAAQLVSVAIMSRTLGPAGMAVIGTAWAFYNMALPFVQNAPEMMGIRDLARKRWRLSVIGEINFLKLAMAAAAIAVLSALGLVLYAGQPAMVLQIAVQNTVFIGLALSVAWVFRGLQRFDIHAGIRSFQAVAMALGLYLVLPAVPREWAVPLVELATFLAAAAIGIVLLRKSLTGLGRRPPRPPILSLSHRRRAFRRHGPAITTQGLTGLTAAIMWSICIPEAGLFLSSDGVGNLAAALRLILAVVAVVLLVAQLFFPILARDRSRDPEAGKEMAAALLFYITLFSCALYGLLWALAEPLSVVIFGAEFVDVPDLVRLIGIGIVFVGIGSVHTYVLLAADRERLVLAFQVVTAAVVAVANIAAFALWPVPHAAAVMTIVLAVHTVARAWACHRHGLIARGAFSLRRLRPSEIRTFLAAR